MKQTKRILIFILYWILFSGAIQQYIYNSEFIPLIPDFLLLCLAFFILPLQKRKQAFRIGGYIPLLFTILLLGGTIVSIVNFMPLRSVLWGIRMIVRYLLLFIFVYQTFSLSDVIRFKRIFTKVFWINLLLIIFQYFIEGKFGDAVGGIFGGNGLLFVFNLLCIFLFSADYFQGKLRLGKYALILASQMFIAMAAEIKMMYFTIPLAVYAVYVMMKKFSVKHIAVLVVAFFGLVPAMSSVMSLMYGEEYIARTFDRESIENETSKTYSFSAGEDVGFNRNTSIMLAGKIILTDPIHLITGYGIGSANASSIFGTWIFARYGVLTSYNYFTPSYLLIEFGWLGFLIWIIVLLLITCRFYITYRTTNDQYTKYWASTGCLSALFTYILAWYNNVPYCDAYLLYFLWAVCVVAVKYRQKEISSGSRI